ncbi:general secretion pathway protein GspB [Kangiella shandongensis]|uniref:general secretion pathway protein GspB n=1 Tax=Kangiella shandongensis TaxID=2763258 RepID=UPI001CBAB889|nr:general secretion pathway protein GspB [Kangiella shandongensis]
MSYILDALKKDKTDSNKEQDEIPDLSSEHAIYEFEEEKSAIRWFWPIVVMVLVLIICVLLFMLFNPSSQQFAKYIEQQPKQVAQPSKIVATAKKEQQADAAVAEVNQTQLQQESMVASKPIQVASPVVERVERKPVARTSNTASQISAHEGTERANSTDAISKADLPSLVYTTHIYATQPKDRFVMLNGRAYAEGDRISKDFHVKEILENDLVVSFKGKEFILPSLEDVNVDSP